MHAAHAVEKGIPTTNHLDCDLLQSLDKIGDHKKALEDENEYSDDNYHAFKYKEEKKQLAKRSNKNPRYDIQLLVEHYQNHEHHEVTTLAWDILEAHHPNEMKSMDIEASAVFHHRLVLLIGAIAEGVKCYIKENKCVHFCKARN